MGGQIKYKINGQDYVYMDENEVRTLNLKKRDIIQIAADENHIQWHQLYKAIKKIRSLSKTQQRKLQKFIFNQQQVKLSKLKYAHVKNLTALFKNENLEENFIKSLSKNIQILKCGKSNAKSNCICGMYFRYEKSVYKHRKKCEIYQNVHKSKDEETNQNQQKDETKPNWEQTKPKK